MSDVKSNNVAKEKISVAGTAKSAAAKVEQVTYSLKSAMEESASVTGTATGAENWRIESFPLQIGTNFLTISAKDSKKHVTTKEIVLNRLSTEIELSENVVLFDEEQNKEIADEILDYWTDDRGTEDPSDDLVNLLFRENAELVRSVKENRIKIGGVMMLQACEALYLGFNGMVASYEDPKDRVKYPADEFEVISFQIADMADLFNDDVSLSYEIADVENPLAFAYFPTDVEIASLDGSGNRQTVLYASDGYGDQSKKQQISGEGFQKIAIPYMMQDGCKVTGGVNTDSGLHLGITFKDAILYDRDGNENTKNDQFKIGGKMAYENFRVDAGVEWHRDFFHGKILPQ